MESYKLMPDGTIQRQSDLAVIQVSSDYLLFLKNIKEGATLTRFDQAAEDKRQTEEQIKIQKEIDINRIDLAITGKTIELVIPLVDGDSAKITSVRAEIETLQKAKDDLEK